MQMRTGGFGGTIERQISQQINNAQNKIDDAKKEAENSITSQATQLDSMLNGFLTGAIAPAVAGTQAGVSTRDALGLTTGDKNATIKPESSVMPLLLAAGLGYYFLIKRKGRI